MRYILYILTFSLFQNCISVSTDNIQRLEEPNYFILNDFGLHKTGKIIYQFYQSYGFTDKEEQLIMIIEADNVDMLKYDLPIDSLKIRRIEHIDFIKFTNNGQIDFEPEKTIHSDIRLKSWEYDVSDKKKVFCKEGKYSLFQNDSLETIIIYDEKTKLMYVESKKNK